MMPQLFPVVTHRLFKMEAQHPEQYVVCIGCYGAGTKQSYTYGLNIVLIEPYRCPECLGAGFWRLPVLQKTVEQNKS